eukprot:CAMPEP_0114360156 /NCGR_PEP_ID=MMETSP0101-20121206/23618_1 /TAXON_ID=38822 ORGANISM="Pteridomonas danica, Strain PT" /NCGR_SAMPLE_ID=MMETSP0101 /ASSEMBLY_ACC=CAM_ASM_000211 /LENGTH=311 /DNA_ID=CAMNT_0001504183 /DNA_START=80 /DNA_END=1015 /DNA_ORIENTATION=+
MTASGFCRNCLSKWLLAGYRNMAPLPLDQPLTYDDVSFSVYGMSPKDWKKEYQSPATEEQLRRYDESKKYHATHAKNVLEEISTFQPKKEANPLNDDAENTTEVIKDPCCPESTEAIAVIGKDENCFEKQCPEPPPTELKLGILTVSDRAFNGVYKDESGPRIRKLFSEYSMNHPQVQLSVSEEKIVPDEMNEISNTLNEWSKPNNENENGGSGLIPCNLIITTGGTGLSDRDVTPEATLSIINKQITSIPLSICHQTLKFEPLACLSRGISGIIGQKTIVLNVPGSPTAVEQHLNVAIPLLIHALRAISE